MLSPSTTDDVRLVITPPGPSGAQLARRLGARTTYGVLIELATTANTHLLLATPFIHLGEALLAGSLVEALEHALRRNVRLDVVSTVESLAALKSNVPQLVSHSGVYLYRPHATLSPSRLGSHAKVLASDGNAAYVGSANFTDPGMTTNLEMGVLLKGLLARQVSAFWSHLIDSGFLEPVAK